MFPATLIDRAATLVEACRARQIMLASAESCTGGLVAALITEVSGSSAVLDRGLVTYSDEAKRDLLGVPEQVIAVHGAVSPECARAMASGALERSRAHITVAITGIAGPTGGSPAKPVGLVYFGLSRRDGPTTSLERRFGDVGRSAVRMRSVDQALLLIEEAVADLA